MAKRKNVTGSDATLFPIPKKAEWVDPVGLGGVHSGPVCRCDDSCEYVTKDASWHPHIPHSEWFCTKLAELVGIASPPCAVIEMNGTMVFGSRLESNLLPPAAPWYDDVATGVIPLANIKAALTRIYAFDHFVHNIDRHAKNFIVRQQKNSAAVIANDYSKAWLVNGFPLPTLPIVAGSPHESTVTCQRQLRALIGNYIDVAEARKTMEMIKKIPPIRIRNIIEEHPSIWLDKKKKDDILQWWISAGGMRVRAEQVAKGIENGTYL